MEFEFDKEMDALLRQTAKDETVLPTNGTQNHLDPDEISAFAENALPVKARSRITKHLADCNSCRVSLSNLIVLNSEAETEVKAASIATEMSETETASVEAVPWYKKLFAYQNLAYGLGALVILFAGFTAFIIFQNVSNSGNSEVAQADKSAQNINAVSAPETRNQTSKEEVAADDFSADTNTAENSAPLTEKDGDVSVDPRVAQTPLSKNRKELSPTDNRQRVGRLNDRVGLAEGESKTAGEDRTDDFEDKPVDQPKREADKLSDVTVSKTEIAEEPEPAEKPQAPPKVVRSESPITTRGGNKTANKKKTLEDSKDENKRDDDAVSLRSGNRRQVGGKTFRRANGVWIDTAYKNQKTTNVRRGTSQYRQLDSGLRSITDKLSGIVIVVWKSKAYRIE